MTFHHIRWGNIASLSGPGGGGGGSSLTITNTDHDFQNVVGQSTYTFTSKSIGTSDPTRIIAVGIVCTWNTGGVSSVTIGGNAATHATGANFTNSGGSSTCLSDIYYIADSSVNTTETIVVNFSAVQYNCGIVVYSVTGSGASFASAGGTGMGNSGSLTSTSVGPITVPSTGGAISILYLVTNNTTSGTITCPQLTTIDQTGIALVANADYGMWGSTLTAGSTTFNYGWTPSRGGVVSVIAFNG